MRRKSTVVLVSIVAILLPFHSFALGLGDLTVESDLASPLQARVSVNGMDRSNVIPDQLLIKINSRITASVPQLYYRVEQTNGDSTAIVIFSRQTISAPIFSFNLQVDWDKGSIARDYDVLVDPPTYNTGPALADLTSTQLSQSEQPDSTLIAGNPDNKQIYGPTVSGNSLWRVARSVRSDNADLTMYQWMHGIWLDNQQAFEQANMHRLQLDQLLSIPLEQAILKFSPETAYRSYTDHLAKLQPAENKTADVTVKPDLASDNPVTSPTDNSKQTDEATEIPLAVIDLVNVLATAEIEDQANADTGLVGTVQEAETQIDTAQSESLISEPLLDDNQMIEDESIVSSTSSPDLVTSTGTDNSMTIESPGMVSATLRGIAQSLSAVPNWIAMLFGVMVTLLILWLTRGLRSTPPPAQTRPGTVTPAAISERENVSETGTSSTLMSEIRDSDTESTADDNIDQKTSVTSSLDVAGLLVEADVLVGYGDTDSAIKILQHAMQQHPSESGVGLHLLRLYYKTRDVDAFTETFEEMMPAILALDKNEQILWQWKRGDLCQETAAIIENEPDATIEMTEVTPMPADRSIDLSASDDDSRDDLTDHIDTDPTNFEGIDYSYDTIADQTADPLTSDSTVITEATRNRHQSEDTLEFFGFADDDAIEFEALDLEEEALSFLDDIDNTEESTIAIESPVFATDDVSQDNYDELPDNLDDEDPSLTLSFIDDTDSTPEPAKVTEAPVFAPTEVLATDSVGQEKNPIIKPFGGRVLPFPNSAAADENREFETQLMSTLQAMRDQMQQMNERLFSQERDNQRLRKTLEELTTDAATDKRDKA